jgi:Mg-chelatase subunit ChlD
MSESESLEDLDPRAALEVLAGCRAPLLIGVRHHSPLCSAAIPNLLTEFAPTRLFIELPVELEPWLKWLGSPELDAPVALAAVSREGRDLAFYPFADFSPELAAVRWAARAGVSVEAFDLPLSTREDREPGQSHTEPTLVSRLEQALAADDPDELWDRLVEVRAVGQSPEAVRRAALLAGWAMRVDTVQRGGVSTYDLRREAFMRARLAAASGERIAAVVGAFHGPALLPEPLLFTAPPPVANTGVQSDVVSSLIPYSHDLLDSRSGYPAGIRDPIWQQRVYEAACSGQSLRDVASVCFTELGRAVREQGHVAGVPDTSEALRLCDDLARLRGLPAPGRREVLEAVQTAMAQGELLGRGRILARALDRTLVGRKRGRLPRDAPRSGLVVHVQALLEELRLPGPGTIRDEPSELRLDPLRSMLDRRRHIAFERLGACGVPYARRIGTDVAVIGEILTYRWAVQWAPATDAMIEAAGLRGVTLAQASAGMLAAERRKLEDAEQWVPSRQIAWLEQCALCGLPTLLEEGLASVRTSFLEQAGLRELVSALLLFARIRRGHIPALVDGDGERIPGELEPFSGIPVDLGAELLAAAVRSVEGLSGSEREEDVAALLELVRLLDTEARDIGEGRLRWTLQRLSETGSPLMQGACGAARVWLGLEHAAPFGARLGAWLDGATSRDALHALESRLRGTLLMASPLLEADPALTEPICARVEALDDEAFLRRVAALRGGFSRLSPAARQRLLTTLRERLGEADPHGGGPEVVLEEAQEWLAGFATDDRGGARAIAAFGAELGTSLPTGVDPTSRVTDEPRERPALGHSIAPMDRWRLILGRERDRLPPRAGRVARALDELYGQGKGEGSRALRAGGGGQEDPFPGVREWSEELGDLFGSEVREEVLAKAAAMGLPAALMELDPDRVQPSVELLEQVLSLKGGLGEKQLAHLRRLVARVVDQLVKELATRVRPALVGLSTPQPSRRPVGPLDLRRTVRKNLKTARMRADGTYELTAEELVFHTRAKRSMDWHVVIVVDVSGSMEPSVIYSAMMAAIFSSLPGLSTSFFAFSTEVIDLTERVDDPLGLLLEVEIGGGTHIAKAIAHARASLRVPCRSLVIVVSDFEEGYSVGSLIAEVRALVETGAKALGIAALDERGQPRYSGSVAELVAGAGMPVAALTPLQLAQWVGDQIR